MLHLVVYSLLFSLIDIDFGVVLGHAFTDTEVNAHAVKMLFDPLDDFIIGHVGNVINYINFVGYQNFHCFAHTPTTTCLLLKPLFFTTDNQVVRKDYILSVVR